MSKTSSIERLAEAVDWSYERMGDERNARRRRIDAFRAKYNDSEYELHGRKTLNMTELMTQIYSRLLAARNPQVSITTKYASLKPYAAQTEIAANHSIRKKQLVHVLRRGVVDGLFGMGVVHTMVSEDEPVEIDGMLASYGQIMTKRISFDDFVVDMAAKELETAQYFGHRFRVPLEWAMKNPRFDKTERAKLKALRYRSEDFEDGDFGEDDDEVKLYRDMTTLWSIWCVADGTIKIFPHPIKSIDKPLEVRKWEGPPEGPYSILSYMTAPDQLLPSSTASVIFPLDMAVNDLMNKAITQALRQKKLVTGANEDNLETLMQAKDGDFIITDPGAKHEELTLTAIDQQLLAFILQLRDVGSWTLGNLDLLGGLSPQSETLGQDKLLNENASMRISDMRDMTIEWTQRILERELWLMWNDPFWEEDLVMTIPGVPGIEIPFTYGPESRKGDFYDYNMRVVPFSMGHDTPETKVQKKMMFMERVIMPMMPMLEAQGIVIKGESFIRSIAKDANLDELEDMLAFTMPNPAAALTGGPGLQRPVRTTREYVRTNRPGSSMRSRSDMLTRMLQGSGNTPQQAAQAASPMG